MYFIVVLKLLFFAFLNESVWSISFMGWKKCIDTFYKQPQQKIQTKTLNLVKIKFSFFEIEKSTVEEKKGDVKHEMTL